MTGVGFLVGEKIRALETEGGNVYVRNVALSHASQDSFARSCAT